MRIKMSIEPLKYSHLRGSIDSLKKCLDLIQQHM